MSSFSISSLIVAMMLVLAGINGAAAAEPDKGPCTEDAMIVFDASGSMSGDGWGYGSKSAGSVSRLDKVRATLAEVLPSIIRTPRGPHHLRARSLQSMQRQARAAADRECRDSHPGCGQSADACRKNAADIGRGTSG